MNRRILGLALSLSLATSSFAFAQYDDGPSANPATPPETSDWSILTGRTLGASRTAFQAEFGYPGISFGLISGISSSFDAGGKFTFNYGSPYAFGIAPAVRVQGILKFNIINQTRFSFGLQMEPGLGFQFTGFGTFMEIPLPFLFKFGIHPIEEVGIVVGLDLSPTFGINLVNGAFIFALPIGIGPGVEFKVQDNFMVTFDTRFGPSVVAAGPVVPFFNFKMMLGIALTF